MPKKSKLKTALDVYQGRDHALEHQKKLQKTASQRKRAKLPAHHESEEIEEGDEAEEFGSDGGEEVVDERLEAMMKKIIAGGDADADAHNGNTDSDSQEDEEFHDAMQSTANIDESASSSSPSLADPDSNSDSDLESDTSSIPLSALSSPEPDLLPHQRLTTSNPPALLRSLASIALPLTTLPFSAHQSLTTPTPVAIPDINDDLNRELAFYAQSLSAVRSARSLLRLETPSSSSQAPFTRPADYFAEMVKSDEHMLRIKGKLTDEAASKKASADARRQRDLKRFGKEVQVRKEQERGRERRELGEKIKGLKRKRASGEVGAGGVNEEEMFDVAIENDDATPARRDRDRDGGRGRGRGRGRDASRGRGGREKHDGKYGFGGKKRFAKSGDAASSADLSGFDLRGMKSDRGARGRGSGRGRGASRGRGVSRGGGGQRLGKSRRTGSRP